MKKHFAVLAILILIPFSTLWSQDSTKVAYSDLIEIMVLASKGEQYDSTVVAYEVKLQIRDEKITEKSNQLKLAGELITEQAVKINELSNSLEKSERKRKTLRTFLIGAVGLVVVEGVVIFI